MLPFVTSCKDCPNRIDDQCSKAGGQKIVDKNTVASFCPLPKFPAQEMADVERTINNYRDADNLTLQLQGALLVYVSKMLKTRIWDTGGGLSIQLADGNKVTFQLDYVCSADARQDRVVFLDPRTQVKYKLHLGSTEPMLFKYVPSTKSDASEVLESVDLKLK